MCTILYSRWHNIHKSNQIDMGTIIKKKKRSNSSLCFNAVASSYSLRGAQELLCLSVKWSSPLLPQRPCWDGSTAIAGKRSSHWVATILPSNFDPRHFTPTGRQPLAPAVISEDLFASHKFRYFTSVVKHVATSSWEQLVSLVNQQQQ